MFILGQEGAADLGRAGATLQGLGVLSYFQVQPGSYKGYVSRFSLYLWTSGWTKRSWVFYPSTSPQKAKLGDPAETTWNSQS